VTGVASSSAPAGLPLALDLEPGCAEATLCLACARVGRRLEAGQARANDAPTAIAGNVGDVGEGRAVLAGDVALEGDDAAAAFENRRGRGGGASVSASATLR
jgi:hypothetical protein